MTRTRRTGFSAALTAAALLCLAAPVAAWGASSPASSGASPGRSPGAVARATCGGPVVIRSAGTYHGCYESRRAGVPAVRIATRAHVVLDHATIRHAGYGVLGEAVPVDLTVRSSRLTALDPTRVANQRSVYLYQPTRFVFEHNRLVHGHGLEVNGDDVRTRVLRVRWNDAVDLGHFGARCCIQFVDTDKVLAPGGTIVWNRVVDHYRRSSVEDVVDLYRSNGAQGAPIQVAHNLVDGAYPASGSGASYTGGGLDAGDGGASSWIDVHHNTVVNSANIGAQTPAGHDIHLYRNVIVSDGLADNGARVSSTFATGLSVWKGYATAPSRSSAHDNTVANRRWSGSRWERADWYLPSCRPARACRTNHASTATARAERRAVAAWDAARRAAGVTVGPR